MARGSGGMGMNTKIIGLVCGVALFVPACHRQPTEQSQERERKAIVYVRQVQEEFQSLIDVASDSWGIYRLFSWYRNARILTIVQAQARVASAQMTWMSSIFGESKKVRKRFPLVFCVKKIKIAHKKLAKIARNIELGKITADLDRDALEKLQKDLKSVRIMIKSHPHYERERDLYELQQIVKSGVSGFIKPALSIATKIF